MINFIQQRLCQVVCLWAVLSIPGYAATRIAILEFELLDLTLAPRIQEEKQRAASIKPMLQQVLKDQGDYQFVDISSEAQKQANQGVGYLFDHHDVVAELGSQHQAEFVVMGRVHKASHLFVYFLVQLVDVDTQRLVGNYVVEIKGPQKKLTIKGVESVARKIHKTLSSRSGN
ncbi:MAG: DUF3280 domain-containing protein [Gammaproteobacteria bacterium]|nr:DUF3280 domain-containing protein [Gammaproteobacteria bacterium]